jgi:hypothetical protein
LESGLLDLSGNIDLRSPTFFSLSRILDNEGGDKLAGGFLLRTTHKPGPKSTSLLLA